MALKKKRKKNEEAWTGEIYLTQVILLSQKTFSVSETSDESLLPKIQPNIWQKLWLAVSYLIICILNQVRSTWFMFLQRKLVYFFPNTKQLVANSSMFETLNCST